MKRPQASDVPDGSGWGWRLAVIIVIIALVRIRLLDVPLERDEGEHAYMSQLMLQGVPPFAKAYALKLPGLYVAYAAIMLVFGQTCRGIHLGLLLANAGTTVLLYALARRLFDARVGFVAGVAFAVLSLSQSVLGIYALAEHFVLLPALAGLLLLLTALTSQRPRDYFWSGLLLGLSVMVKQHGAVFAIVAIVYAAREWMTRGPIYWRRAAVSFGAFMAGVFLPFAAACLILFKCGVFDRFWFWTFTYSSAYASANSLADGLHNFLEQIPVLMLPTLPVWCLAAVGLGALLLNSQAHAQRWFVLPFFLFSFLSTTPRMTFGCHYLVLLLPAAALLAALGARVVWDWVSRITRTDLRTWPAVCLAAVFMLYTGFNERRYLFELKPAEVTRYIYGTNPFPEALEIARYIREHSSAEDSIAVIGSEPEIYFYAQRRSATGYILAYPLMEDHPYALQMQKEMIQQIETARPKFMVFVGVPQSWAITPRSHTLILQWFEQFQTEFYDMVGVVDLVFPQTRYVWDEKAVGYSPQSLDRVTVFRCKPTRPRA